MGSEDTPTPSPEAATDTPVVAYGTVDAATVRIFAVGDVRAARVRGRLYPRVLALPEVGHGSGVIVDPRGVVVTAAHVVEGAHHVAVRLPGATEVLAARVVHRDRELDFALLLVLAESPFPAVVPLPEEAPTLTVRQTVDAIGYPLDASRENPQSTRGIVSAATEDGQLQLGISVNPGNSGGPLVDEDEHLVGIVVARGDPSRGVQGIGFGVPVAPIRRAYDGVLRNGRMQRSYLALREDPALERRRAEIVDALVRFGGLDVLREALESVEQSTSAERLAHFEQMADAIDDLPLLELLAAFFWDATLVILERSGSQTRPRRFLTDRRASGRCARKRTRARATHRSRRRLARAAFGVSPASARRAVAAPSPRCRRRGRPPDHVDARTRLDADRLRRLRAADGLAGGRSVFRPGSWCRSRSRATSSRRSGVARRRLPLRVPLRADRDRRLPRRRLPGPARRGDGAARLSPGRLRGPSRVGADLPCRARRRHSERRLRPPLARLGGTFGCLVSPRRRGHPRALFAGPASTPSRGWAVRTRWASRRAARSELRHDRRNASAPSATKGRPHVTSRNQTEISADRPGLFLTPFLADLPGP
ncbi:MAG: trypsin-like peptidase domain-containing protein [Sandaracinus sp.]|nr:trypsin-like peptidase domain-containing protein [Sandaracinus sp.]